jgi:hypothetical protein
MTATMGVKHTGTTAYSGLDFIKAAFRPLDFNAIRFADRSDYRQWCKGEEVRNGIGVPGLAMARG